MHPFYCLHPFLMFLLPAAPEHLILTPSLAQVPPETLEYLSLPQNVVCFSKAGPGSDFVNKSASFSSVLIHSIFIVPSSFSSQRKRCWTSTRQVHPPMLQLLAKSTAPLLSICNIIGFSTVKPTDSSTFITYSISCARHCCCTLCLFVDKLTVLCMALLNVIGESFRNTQHPVTLRLVSGHFA